MQIYANMLDMLDSGCGNVSAIRRGIHRCLAFFGHWLFQGVVVIDDLAELWLKSFFSYRLQKLLLINCISIKAHEQQILQLNCFGIAIPFVFHQLPALKP